jgi:cyclohexyl-isocyanide hydratase
MTTKPPFHIVIPIYQSVNLFDVTSACEVFYWMGRNWNKEEVTIALVEAKGSVVKTLAGPRLTPDGSFADYRHDDGRVKKQAQLIWVPGAGNDTTEKMMNDSDYLNFLREQAVGATYVTSVCEGAMLLAAAGLLDGYTATSHWAVVSCLRAFKGVTVAPGLPRFWIDRNRVTGGGISSGLDESLGIVQLHCGDEIAERIQRVTQYFPKPPVMGSFPDEVPCSINVPAPKAPPTPQSDTPKS